MRAEKVSSQPTATAQPKAAPAKGKHMIVTSRNRYLLLTPAEPAKAATPASTSNSDIKPWALVSHEFVAENSGQSSLLLHCMTHVPADELTINPGDIVDLVEDINADWYDREL